MKLLREPLVHFAVAGVVLFSVYSWLNESRPAAEASSRCGSAPGRSNG